MKEGLNANFNKNPQIETTLTLSRTQISLAAYIFFKFKNPK